MKKFMHYLMVVITQIILYFIVCYIVQHDCVNHKSSGYKPSAISMSQFYKDHSDSIVQIFTTTDGNKGSGSGVYIADNLIVTNAHVTRRVVKEDVTIVSNQGILTGRVVEFYPNLDLALVYTHSNRGVPVEMGTSYDLEIGDRAVSIGASFGFYSTLGVGYVTGLNRFVGLPPFNGIISVSTGIMPGNSGGGVFGIDGKLIGISYAGARSSDNMGFIIPVDLVKQTFAEYLLAKDKNVE